MGEATPIGEPRRLFAFDFDHTILSENSDTAIVKLLDGGVGGPLPLFDGMDWTAHMNAVLSFLHSKGITVPQITTYVANMNPTQGMVTLLQQLHAHINSTTTEGITKDELLIISDANDIFIPAFLSSIGIQPNQYKMITNRAKVTESGAITLTPYEDQEECPICPRNMCKGAAIQGIIREAERIGVPFSGGVFYVGDGRNDACPGMRLSKNDHFFVRRGYNLEKILSKGRIVLHPKNNKNKDNKGHGISNEVKKEIEVEIKAKVYYWDNAQTIASVMFPSL